MASHETHADLAIKIACEVRREEYLDYMTFRENTRPLFIEIFGPLIGLKTEWKQQGATEQELDLSAYQFRCPMKAGVPVNTGWMGGASQTVIEETDQHSIVLDHMGRRMKLLKGFATIPLPLDYPVKTMDDWLAIKRHYEFSEARFREGWQEKAKADLEAGRAIVVSIPGGFDEPRQLMGEEGACVAVYEQPELIHDILDTIGNTAFQVLDRVSSVVQVDELSVHEDMAGKSGPLFGPKHITEFIKPYYRRIWDMLQSRGARLFGQDSDGDMRTVIPAFIDAGINFMYPIEPAAGMDIVKLREEYGQTLAFMGGIDKHILRASQAEITSELEYKIPPMVRTGGCILGLDHRIPNGTPLVNYKFYIRRAWEILERESGGVA